jgi:hypothetical protein
MAIVSAREIWEGRTAKIEQLGKREYTRVFRITTNADTDDAASIVLSPLFPKLYTPYNVPNGVDLGAILHDKTATQDADNPYVWKVTLHYSTVSGDGSRDPGNSDPNDTSGLLANPFARPPLITWDAVQFTRPVVTDINGKPLVNTAGQQFDPLPEMDDSRVVIIYERNEPTFSATNAQNYRDALNSDQWNGMSPGTVKCCKIAASLEYEKGLYYWRMRYEFHVRDTWQLSIINQGWNFLTGDTPPVLRACMSKDNVPVRQCLDNSGHVIPRNNDGSISNVIALKFNIYQSLPFAPLGIIIPG